MRPIFLFAAWAAGLGAAAAQDAIVVPDAPAGFKRYDISTAATADAPRRIEFFVGKSMTIDCNQHMLNGEFVRGEAQGAAYFTFQTDGRTSSTKIACPDETKKAFVIGPAMLVDASERAPLVVYAPDGYELRYHIWGVLERNRTAKAKSD